MGNKIKKSRPVGWQFGGKCPATGKRIWRRRRSGSQILEMALAFPLLLYLVMGMIEFGQYFYIKHCFESAVRDGGRYAILANSTQAQLVNTLTMSLQQANITYNSSWLTITDITAATPVTDVSKVPAGDQVQITLSTTYGNIPNALRPLSSLTGVGISSTKAVNAIYITVKE